MNNAPSTLALSTLIFMTACSPSDDATQEETLEEQSSTTVTSSTISTLGLSFTTLSLNFTPVGGGESLSFFWSDPEGDGDPIVDAIPLPDASNHNHHDAQDYTLDIEMWNDLESPPQDITAEVQNAGDEYQLFFTGSAVEGPATGSNGSAILAHQYADSDASGLPLGLSNDITTMDWGTGQLTVTLRHIPSEDGQSLKTESLASDVAQSGLDAIDGNNEFQISFSVEVE